MELIRTSFNLYIFLHNTRGGTGNNLRNTVFDAGESTHTALKFFFKGILLFEFFFVLSLPDPFSVEDIYIHIGKCLGDGRRRTRCLLNGGEVDQHHLGIFSRG